MAGLLSFFVFAMLLSAVPVFGATEYRLGGISGNDWQAALTEESFGRPLAYLARLPLARLRNRRI